MKNNHNKIKDSLIKFLKNIDIKKLLLINDEYLNIKECHDGQVYHIEELEDVFTFSDISLFEVLSIIHKGYFNPEYSFFVFDNNGNFKSISDSEIFDYINLEEIADYIIKYNNALGNMEIQFILNNM